MLFVCTANVTDSIPGPLLDRMEVIRLSGYDHPEKVQIARNYLIPKVMEQTGLDQVEPGYDKELVKSGKFSIEELYLFVQCRADFRTGKLMRFFKEDVIRAMSA